MKRRTALAALPVALTGCVGVSDSGDDGPDPVDASGEIEIRIDGAAFDLSADRFQAEHAEEHSLAFHLHESDDRWYMEGNEPVTFAEAIDLLPHFEHRRVERSHVIGIDDRTYDEREGAEIEFAVDGEPVDATEYELRDGEPVDATEYELRDGDSLLVTIST